MVGEFLSYEPYGIMFGRNQRVLRDIVTRALRNMVIARDIGPTYDKWFSSRLPNGERFNIPMSPQLEQSFTVLGVDGGGELTRRHSGARVSANPESSAALSETGRSRALRFRVPRLRLRPGMTRSSSARRRYFFASFAGSLTIG